MNANFFSFKNKNKNQNLVGTYINRNKNVGDPIENPHRVDILIMGEND